MKYIRSLFLSILFVLPSLCRADVKLPSVFSDGMVLQQRSHVPLWGSAAPGTAVEITTSWDQKKYRILPDGQGKWKQYVTTPKAGGPYEIRFRNGTEIRLQDVWIGEVWLASGQSNMEMPLKGFKNQPVNNAAAVIAAANPQIRFFDVANTSYGRPLDDCKGVWKTASSATADGFSAVAYFYALELQQKLQVPVGIIEADWGGTVIQAWMSTGNLAAFPQVPVKAAGDSAYSNKNEPAGLYNGMIYPIAGYGIKGCIWYQGEQNRNEPALYARLFPAMVQQWRAEWGQGNFPFYYAQIAPYLFKRAERLPENIAQLKPFVPYLREVQLKAEQLIPNAGMAVLTDIGAEATIHPPDKASVGKRLAALALAKTYSLPGIPYSGPVYQTHKTVKKELVLYFDFAKGLHLKGNTSSNFEIAGADQTFYPATAVVDGAQIRLSAPQVKHPVAARYAFQAWVTGDLFNGAQLPASSFRTDDWELPVKQ